MGYFPYFYFGSNVQQLGQVLSSHVCTVIPFAVHSLFVLNIQFALQSTLIFFLIGGWSILPISLTLPSCEGVYVLQEVSFVTSTSFDVQLLFLL